MGYEKSPNYANELKNWLEHLACNTFSYKFWKDLFGWLVCRSIPYLGLTGPIGHTPPIHAPGNFQDLVHEVLLHFEIPMLGLIGSLQDNYMRVFHFQIYI